MRKSYEMQAREKAAELGVELEFHRNGTQIVVNGRSAFLGHGCNTIPQLWRVVLEGLSEMIVCEGCHLAIWEGFEGLCWKCFEFIQTKKLDEEKRLDAIEFAKANEWEWETELLDYTNLAEEKAPEPVTRLGDDDIAEVCIKETAKRYYPDYSERPTRYMVRLSGENRWRRVYAQPIGNVSCIYLKVKGKDIYCEMALEWALHRANQEFMKGN